MGTISHSVPNAEVEPSHHFLTKFSTAGALYGTNGTNQTSGYQSLHGTEIKLIMRQIYEKHSEILFKGVLRMKRRITHFTPVTDRIMVEVMHFLI